MATADRNFRLGATSNVRMYICQIYSFHCTYYHESFVTNYFVSISSTYFRTSFCIKWVHDQLPSDYIPTIFENITIGKQFIINGVKRLIEIDLR